MACFSYQPAIVKANLQALHKLIKRAREVPVEKMPEKIEVNKSAPVFQEENLEIHDWSKETSKDENENHLPVTTRKNSTLGHILNFSGDKTGMKMQTKIAVEKSFRDPFNPRTIPYKFYLGKTKVDQILQEEESLIK